MKGTESKGEVSTADVGVAEGSSSSTAMGGVEGIGSAALSGFGGEALVMKKPLKDCCPFEEVCELELVRLDLLRFTGFTGDAVDARRFSGAFKGLTGAGAAGFRGTVIGGLL